ncbi:MAG: methyl-accepting chemotaxis protein, partial [Bacteroidales bacterium]
MNLKNIKIGKKLIIGFSSILLVAIIIGYIGYSGMKVIEDQQNLVAENILPSVESLQTINEAQADIYASENLLLAADISPKLHKEAYSRIDSAKVRVAKAWKTYQALPQSAEGSLLWKEFEPAWTNWMEYHDKFIELEHKDNIENTKQSYSAMSNFALTTLTKPYNKANDILTKLVQTNDRIAAESDLIAEKKISLVEMQLLIAILIGVLASMALAVIISRSITRPLAKGVKLAEAVATGDLTVTIDIDQTDEIGQLANALKLMVEKLQSITSDIKNGINVLGTSASEILSTVTEISTGTAETATAVSETTTTVEEVRQTAMV